MDIFLRENLKLLRKQQGRTQASIGLELNVTQQTIGNWETGLSEPSYEQIGQLTNIFGISTDQFLYVDLSKGNLIEKTGEDENAKKGNLKGNRKGNLNTKKDPIIYPLNELQTASYVAEIAPSYGARTPSILVVDQAGLDNILYVPVKARAGYLLGYSDPEYMETLPTFRLPGLRNKDYRMFEVEGNSMAPTLTNGDRLIGEWVESLDRIRENRVHIVVTKSGILVKRVLNRLKERGKIYLKSDTLHHRSEHPTIELDPSEIIEIWYGRLKLSGDLSEPGELFNRVNDLEVKFLEMEKLLQVGKKEIQPKKGHS